MDCRKTRNNSFYIFSRLFSQSSIVSVFPSRLLRKGAACRRFFGLRPHQLWIALLLIQYLQLTSSWLFPAAISCRTSSFNASLWCSIPFSRHNNSPDVVLLFSYSRGFYLLSVFTGSVKLAINCVLSFYRLALIARSLLRCKRSITTCIQKKTGKTFNPAGFFLFTIK